MDRFAEITRKTNEVLANAKALYGVDIKPTVSYNLRGRVAGWAGCKFCAMTRKAKDFTLRFNRCWTRGSSCWTRWTSWSTAAAGCCATIR